MAIQQVAAAAASANVTAAFTKIQDMFAQLSQLRGVADGLTLGVADVYNPISVPTPAQEPGYVDWPNADFKACELAWAQALTYLGLSGLTWKFPLRGRKVSDAYAITEALLTKARVLGITQISTGVPWSLLALAGGVWFFFFRKKKPGSKSWF